MKLLLMYDLPMQTKRQKKLYQIFHKQLYKNGYVMIQKSVYVKDVNNYSKYLLHKEKLLSLIPSEGTIRLLSLSDKQYKKIEIILGKTRVQERVLINGDFAKY